MAKVLVLLSGGIDSLVVAEHYHQLDLLAGCVFVDYGHPAQVKEGWKAFAYCGSRGVPLKAVHAFGLDLGDMASEAGARVVPHRNATLVSLAANAAASLGAEAVALGACGADQRDYPDCRRAFFDALQEALGIDVLTPLVGMSKPDIIAKAQAMGLTRADAWSCYLGGPTECGACPSCIEAEKAWRS